MVYLAGTVDGRWREDKRQDVTIWIRSEGKFKRDGEDYLLLPPTSFIALKRRRIPFDTSLTMDLVDTTDTRCYDVFQSTLCGHRILTTSGNVYHVGQ